MPSCRECYSNWDDPFEICPNCKSTNIIGGAPKIEPPLIYPPRTNAPIDGLLTTGEAQKNVKQWGSGPAPYPAPRSEARRGQEGVQSTANTQGPAPATETIDFLQTVCSHCKRPFPLDRMPWQDATGAHICYDCYWKPNGEKAQQDAKVRQFGTGATRSAEANKNDYEGFLSPSALEAFGTYMTKHRVQADGSLRDSDNWQKGIPLASYRKSMVRHVIDLWALERGHVTAGVLVDHHDREDSAKVKLDLACAILFNVQGYIHELLKETR